MKQTVTRCQKCVLSSAFPRISFDNEGVCSFCNDTMFFTIEDEAIAQAKEEMLQLFDGVRKKDGYHGIVCYSGGKDSTLTLVRAVKTYGLRVLAFTLDNGFISETAFRNMHRVLDTLGVDHIQMRPSKENFKKIVKACVLKEIYPPRTLSRISAVCNACISMVNIGALRLAHEKNIPLIISGFTLGQIPVNAIIFQSDYRFLHENRKSVLEKLRHEAGAFIDTYYTISDKTVAEALQAPYNVNPLCIESKTEEEILSEIAAYGWVAPSDVDGCSSNCRLNSFNNHVHELRYEFNPYELELSHLIRKGLLTREEALHKIKDKRDVVIDEIMRELNITDSQVRSS